MVFFFCKIILYYVWINNNKYPIYFFSWKQRRKNIVCTSPAHLTSNYVIYKNEFDTPVQEQWLIVVKNDNMCVLVPLPVRCNYFGEDKRVKQLTRLFLLWTQNICICQMLLLWAKLLVEFFFFTMFPWLCLVIFKRGKKSLIIFIIYIVKPWICINTITWFSRYHVIGLWLDLIPPPLLNQLLL